MITFEGKGVYATTTDQTIVLDGGSIYSSSGSENDGDNYLNKFVLNSGAFAYGTGFRVGTKNITWSAGGNKPSIIHNRIKCVSGVMGGESEYVMTWKVDDASNDSSVDLYMHGDMTDFEDGGGGATPNGGMVHLKDGEGTLRWGGESTCTGLVRVVRGTLVLGNAKALNPGNILGGQYGAKQPLEIAGGTLALEPSIACTALSLSLSNSGAINLPEGASFDVDGAGEFADGATLNVLLAKDATLRFGSPLTYKQLRAIRVNGVRAKQLPDGSVCAKPAQLKLILR
jgi:autotransporter-associated beta strand protein